jgi:hypothetical protein
MNAASLVLVVCAIAVTGGLIFIVSPVLTGTTITEPEPLPLYMVYNQDPVQSHSVRISVSNATAADFFNETFTLPSREHVASGFPAPDSFRKYTFAVAVDGAAPLQVTRDLGPTTVAVFDLHSPDDPDTVSCSVIDLTPVNSRSDKN